MRKTPSWRLWLTLILVAASALTYLIHYLIFRDVHHIIIYLVGDIAFLFINVLVVTLFIERVLARREKQALIKKLNMVIGTFFSEVGLDLLNRFSTFVSQATDLQKKLEIRPTWSRRDFQEAIKESRKFPYGVSIDAGALAGLQQFLIHKRSFMLHLLDNPSLLEHERFTDMLWAVFHLAEELAFRGDRIGRLPQPDYDHLGHDLKRAYSQIVGEWIAYTQHLKESYPFLFSLAARINPFSPNPTAIISRGEDG